MLVKNNDPVFSGLKLNVIKIKVKRFLSIKLWERIENPDPVPKYSIIIPHTLSFVSPKLLSGLQPGKWEKTVAFCVGVICAVFFYYNIVILHSDHWSPFKWYKGCPEKDQMMKYVWQYKNTNAQTYILGWDIRIQVHNDGIYILASLQVAAVTTELCTHSKKEISSYSAVKFSCWIWTTRRFSEAGIYLFKM